MAQIDSFQMLQYLNMLLKHGNFTKAAKDLYISQPYLTQSIQRVEKEYGIKIINRQTTPLQLTEAGKAYYQYLNTLELQQAQFRKQISKFTQTNQTTLRIGILASLGTYLLPLFLPKFLAQQPEIKIELQEGIPEVNELKLKNQEIDLLIGQNPETIGPNVTVYSRGKHGYLAIIPKSSHLYQTGKTYLEPNSLLIEDLLKEKLILTTNGSAIRRQIDFLTQKYKIQPNLLLESDNIFTAVRLAKANLGVTFVPESVEIALTKYDEVNLYPIPLDILSLDYFIAHPVNKELSDEEQQLIDLFLAAVQKQLP